MTPPMTDDLVGRLRLQAKHGLLGVPNDHKFVSFAEAAARIEALEGALRWIADCDEVTIMCDPLGSQRIARAALAKDSPHAD